MKKVLVLILAIFLMVGAMAFAVESGGAGSLIAFDGLPVMEVESGVSAIGFSVPTVRDVMESTYNFVYKKVDGTAMGLPHYILRASQTKPRYDYGGVADRLKFPRE